jgi:DNA-damage-inducible protein J
MALHNIQGAIMKSATINARIELPLKIEVDKILKQMGITTTQAITMFYNQIKNSRGIPFELRIPNEETVEAMKDSLADKNMERVTLEELIEEARVRVVK